MSSLVDHLGEARASRPGDFAGDPVRFAWSKIAERRRFEDAVRPWPTLHDDALHGLAGRIVTTLAPHTESDPAALLLTALAFFGSAVGPGPYAMADGAKHTARLFGLVVGDTSRARKGTSAGTIRRVFEFADAAWLESALVAGGIGSGEGLIGLVRDGLDDEPPRERRCLVMEPEFARLLAATGRESSTLSAVLRCAWDSGDLRLVTRKDPLKATGAHISIVAHITQEELRRHLSATEIANGFVNRFLFVAVRRSQLLPNGGALSDEEIRPLGKDLQSAIYEARKIGRVNRDREAEALWHEMYAEIALSNEEGMCAAITARAEAHVLRLSVVYALMDGSNVVRPEHLLAAKALWDYSVGSTRWVFGGHLGDPLAERLLVALLEAGESGLTKEAQSAVFGRNLNRSVLDATRTGLVEQGRAFWREVPTGGRPAHVLVASQYEENEVDEGRAS